MSAFVSMVYPDRVEMLTDGATCLPSGTLIHRTDKVRASHRVPMAITGRGRHEDVARFADAILDLTKTLTVDETLEAVAAALDAGVFQETDQPYEIVLACISESCGPRQLVFTSMARPDAEPSVEAFKLHDLTELRMIAGGVPIIPEDVPGVTATDIGTGLRAVGVPLFEAMRRRGKGDAWGGGEAYWIGGHIDWTVVDADGVRTERIHEWPDQLFQMIQPGVGAAREAG